MWKVLEELRVETSGIFKHSCLSQSNIIREDTRALKELRDDRSWVILTVDKALAIVMPDKQDYISKA